MVGFPESSLEGYSQVGDEDAGIYLYAKEGKNEFLFYCPPKLGDRRHTRELIVWGD